MFGKSFLEECVGKNASLREAIHAFANFHVDVSIKSLLVGVLMVSSCIHSGQVVC
jgi:hypothetical protein